MSNTFFATSIPLFLFLSNGSLPMLYFIAIGRNYHLIRLAIDIIVMIWYRIQKTSGNNIKLTKFYNATPFDSMVTCQSNICFVAYLINISISRCGFYIYILSNYLETNIWAGITEYNILHINYSGRSCYLHEISVIFFRLLQFTPIHPCMSIDMYSWNEILSIKFWQALCCLILFFCYGFTIAPKTNLCRWE